MRPIRASEIGSFLFCRRAWWYRGQGVESENQAELAGGTVFHEEHGRQVVAAGLMSWAARALLLAALLVLAVWLAGKLVP